MTRIYLPIGAQREPYPRPKDERENLLNRLWHARTMIPGSRTMPISQLRDYVQRQEFKLKEEMLQKATQIQKQISVQEHNHIVGALKEYLAWRRKKNAST